MQQLFYVTLLIVTTAIWGYVFYKKDYHPQPFKVIVWSFLTGLFAMIPIFAYKYIYQNFLPMLSEYAIFKPILYSSLLSGFGMFALNLIMLSLILYALSGIISLLLNFFSHNVLINLKNAIKDEPLSFAFVSLLLGIMIYLQSAAQNVFGVQVLGTTLGTILFLAIIEEYIKHLSVRIADDKKLRDIDDAITLSIVVGLAFAFIETIIYSFSAGEMSLIFYRAIISMPVHLVASGIFGYYYGLAHFAEPITKLEEGNDRIYRTKWLPKILCLKSSALYDEEKMVEGIFFAALFHAAMNILFEVNLGFLAVPFIVLGIALLFRLYKLGEIENTMILRLKKKGLHKIRRAPKLLAN